MPAVGHNTDASDSPDTMKYIDEYASEDDCERSESDNDNDDSLEAQIRAADQRDFTDAQWAQIRTENYGLFIAHQLAAAKAVRI